MRFVPFLRTISQFTLEQLPQLLSRFESNVADAVGKLDTDKTDMLWPTPIKVGTYTAKLGDAVTVDTRFGNVDVFLPVATPANLGKRCGVIHVNATNAVHVKSVGQLVQGAAYDTITQIGYWEYVSTGSGWYRPGAAV